VKLLIFILVTSIITFLIAAGVCYGSDYDGKGAIFLAMGAILIIGTYQFYESSNNKKKANNDSGNTNYDGCSSFDCCQPIDYHTSGDCSLLDHLINFDCSRGDCNSG